MVNKKVSENFCNERHKSVNDDIYEIKEDVKIIKNNHLFYIEKAIATIMVWIKLLTIIFGACISTIIGLIFGGII